MEGFDLFGNPERLGRGQRGRPKYEATAKDANKVRLLLAMGWSNTRVAHGVGISLATLKRYFRAELKIREEMRDRLDARRLEIAMDLANAGNVAALKELGRMIEKNDLFRAAAAFDRETDSEPAEEKIGKKEAAARLAKQAGDDSDWGDDLKFDERMN